jgi:hypothetical protein
MSNPNGLHDRIKGSLILFQTQKKAAEFNSTAFGLQRPGGFRGYMMPPEK